jgi:hypothetical protein
MQLLHVHLGAHTPTAHTTFYRDRQALLWSDGKNEAVDIEGSNVTSFRYAPEYWQVRHNIVFRNSFVGNSANKFALDKDDGTSGFKELDNVLVFGGIKDRDGVSDILIVIPT